MEGFSEVTKAAAGEAVEEAAEAVEVEIAATQTMEAKDMPKDTAETMDIDMEGR